MLRNSLPYTSGLLGLQPTKKDNGRETSVGSVDDVPLKVAWKKRRLEAVGMEKIPAAR